MPAPDILELLLRGAAFGTLIATGVTLARARAGPLGVRISGFLFTLSIAGYALNSSPPVREALGPLLWPFHFLALAGVGWAWLFTLCLFEDRVISWPLLGPAAALTLLGLAGIAAGRPLAHGVWIAHNLVEAALAVHALVVILRSWRGDLVETRRRLRGPFLTLVTAYAIVLSALEIGQELGVNPAWYALAGAAMLALLSTAGAIVFLTPRTDLFGAAARQAALPDGLDPRDRSTLAALEKAMTGDEIWRREGLTIASLAEAVSAPEHRLRRLINDHLGARNFAAFVNARRIEAAKAALEADARKTVAAIAFELGFASLGPFNRAFKEATGQTPSEWRRARLG
jgi:AraC-like DNA-binding protein